MTTKDSVTHWLELADYDWKSAQIMFENKRYLYVGFLCHQVVEKSYKALYTQKHSQIAPYTHDLIKLASLTIAPSEDALKNHLNTLNPLYIKCRYPSYKIKLSNVLTSQRAKEIMEATKELKQWLKSQIK